MTDDTTDQPRAPQGDALLTAARVVLTIIIAIVCLTGLGLIVGAALLPVFQERISASIMTETGKPFGPDLIVTAELLFAIIFAMGVLAYRWLRQLGRIIASVGQHDPFAPVNAERLANMGWLTVGIEALSIPAGVIAGYLTKHFDRAHIDFGLSLGGVLMALVLFILARVFREGAAMRADLEGTV